MSVDTPIPGNQLIARCQSSKCSTFGVTHRRKLSLLNSVPEPSPPLSLFGRNLVHSPSQARSCLRNGACLSGITCLVAVVESIGLRHWASPTQLTLIGRPWVALSVRLRFHDASSSSNMQRNGLPVVLRWSDVALALILLALGVASLLRLAFILSDARVASILGPRASPASKMVTPYHEPGHHTYHHPQPLCLVLPIAAGATTFSIC